MKANRLTKVRPMFTYMMEEVVKQVMTKKGEMGVVLLTYRGSPLRAPFTRAKQGYWSTAKTADRARTIPYSFPKWHDGKLRAQTEGSGDFAILSLYIHLS